MNTRSSFPNDHHKPRMLKDFLGDDLNSCSSGGFRSFPRYPSKQPTGYRRKWDSPATSAFHRASEIAISAVKFLRLSSVKSPSGLTRSISRKLSRRNSSSSIRKNDVVEKVNVTVKVKDILRWRSFRDVGEEERQPLDLISSPNHCTTDTCTTKSSSSNSKRSSWCESDFTEEDSPVWCGGGNEVKMGKKFLPENSVGAYARDPTRATIMDSKSKGEMPSDDENDQHSPISVLDSPFQEEEEEEWLSPFHQTLVNMERRKRMLMERIQEFESLAEAHETNMVEFEEEEADEIEEKANRLLHHFRSTTLNESCKFNAEHLLFDFFVEEFQKNRDEKREGCEAEMLRDAEAWASRECRGLFEVELEDKKEECVRDIERGVRWKKFVDEEEEVARVIERVVFSDLIDELFIDLLDQ